MDGASGTKEAYTCNKGNYKGYYKMRPESNNRLQYLSEVWFRGRSCLDIGCNDGQFCIALAESFEPAYILGIDPDFVLIDSAQSRLKRLIYAHKNSVADNKVTETISSIASDEKPKSNPVVAFRSGFLPRALANKTPAKRPVPLSTTGSKPDTAKSALVSTASTAANGPNISTPGPILSTNSTTFPHNVVFKARDAFDISCTLSSQKEGKYDIITCFSVTKWIHLNGGDSKLLEFFCRLFSLVRTGGRVVVEYQPWKSYENNKATSELTKAIFPTIQIKPDLFEWVLTFIVGFEIEARLGPHLDHAKGFDRPILVLRRPASSTGTITNSNETGGIGKNSSTSGYRDGKKLWENVGGFSDLANIVYKRIQRGTVVSILNTSSNIRTDSASANSVKDSAINGVSGSVVSNDTPSTIKRAANTIDSEEAVQGNKKRKK